MRCRYLLVICIVGVVGQYAVIFGVQTGSDPRNLDGGLIGLMQIVTLIILGTLTIMCLTYWLLRRSEREEPEEIFP